MVARGTTFCVGLAGAFGAWGTPVMTIGPKSWLVAAGLATVGAPPAPVRARATAAASPVRCARLFMLSSDDKGACAKGPGLPSGRPGRTAKWSVVGRADAGN